MTYQEWFEEIEKVRIQLLEGAITYQDYFNRVIYTAMMVTEENK